MFLPLPELKQMQKGFSLYSELILYLFYELFSFTGDLLYSF